MIHGRSVPRLFFLPPTSHELQYIFVTRGFTRCKNHRMLSFRTIIQLGDLEKKINLKIVQRIFKLSSHVFFKFLVADLI